MKSKFFYLQTLHFLNDGFSAALFLFFPFIAHDLYLNLTQVGTLGTGLNSLAIFLALPAAFLANKFGNFKILLWAAFIYSFGYVAIAGVHSYWLLLAILILVGSGFALFHPIAFALVARWSEPGALGRRLGNFTAWGDAGRIVISGGVTFLIALWGWRVISLAYAAVGLTLIGYIYFFHFRKNLLPQHAPESTEYTVWYLFKNFRFVLASITAAIDNLASAPLLLFLPFLLISKQINPSFLSSFAVAFLVGNMAGKSLFGRWGDRFGNTTVFVSAELCMALLTVLLTMVHAVWLIVIISIALGIATRGTVSPSRAMINEAVAHTKNYEHANGLAELIIMCAGTLAPYLLGVFSDRWGIGFAFRLWSVFAIMAIIPALIFASKKSASVLI